MSENKTSLAYPFLGTFTITSLFGYRDSIQGSYAATSTNHTGLDMAAPLSGDQTVVAACSGVVTKIEKDNAYFGNWVFVSTDSGVGNRYCHLNSIAVKVGQRVNTKEKIGIQGYTGNVSPPGPNGTHLHFEVTEESEWVGFYKNHFMNPAVWFGMQNPAGIKGKTFDGNGFITGNPSETTSTNSTTAASNSIPSSPQSTGIVDGFINTILPSNEYYEIRDIRGVTSDWLYGRRYRVLVDIGGGKTFDVSELRCKFEIIKTAYNEANQSILTIYNLSPDDENKLIKNGQRIIIEAGYNGSQYGVIFIGNIIQPLRSKENGVDYVLTLVSMDSDRYVAYGLINVALVAQQSARDAVNTLITKSSESIDRGFLTNLNINYPRGKVMFGMSKDYLAQIAKSENATFYTEDGKVNIVGVQGISPGKIPYFTPQNGLIGTPVQNELGIECDILLNPNIAINSLFHIDNQRITNYRYTQGQPVRSLDSQGIYRVIKITHTGDTRGNDWKTHIEAIGQAGLLPAMASDTNTAIWGS